MGICHALDVSTRYFEKYKSFYMFDSALRENVNSRNVNRPEYLKRSNTCNGVMNIPREAKENEGEITWVLKRVRTF